MCLSIALNFIFGSDFPDLPRQLTLNTSHYNRIEGLYYGYGRGYMIRVRVGLSFWRSTGITVLSLGVTKED